MGTPPTPDERWSSTVVLGDGETAHIRPIRPTDAPALAAFHLRQSPDSIYRRYFSPKPQLTERDLEHFTNIDMVDRVALVVERYGEFVAWASYERWTGRDDADAAFMVDDALHGKGIATLLLEHLATIARSNGIVRFTAEVLADNRPMLAVFSRAGWPVERRFESGVVDLDFSLDDTEEFLDSVERREQRADSRAMARLLLPRTIAVVGASDTPDSVGQRPVAPRDGRPPPVPCSPSTRATTPSADARPGRRCRTCRPTSRWPWSPSRPRSCPPSSRTASPRASAARSSSRPWRAPTSTWPRSSTGPAATASG